MNLWTKPSFSWRFSELISSAAAGKSISDILTQGGEEGPQAGEDEDGNFDEEESPEQHDEQHYAPPNDDDNVAGSRTDNTQPNTEGHATDVQGTDLSNEPHRSPPKVEQNNSESQLREPTHSGGSQTNEGIQNQPSTNNTSNIPQPDAEATVNPSNHISGEEDEDGDLIDYFEEEVTTEKVASTGTSTLQGDELDESNGTY